jgi:hypothetical protein
MRKLITFFWVASWMFFIGDCFYIANEIGFDTIMPTRLKLPLVLSFFLPPMIWISYELFLHNRGRTNN